MDLDQKLSPNFSLRELVRSSTAERQPAVLKTQYAPPAEVVDSLGHLCERVLQPLRDIFGVPIRITSGYRSPELNRLVGGAARSQHLKGEAADCQLADDFLSDPATASLRRHIDSEVLFHTGRPMRSDVNANYYLFVYVCLHLEKFDVDQVIHEYGPGFGRPAWVHLAASRGRDGKRQIVALGRHVKAAQKRPLLADALAFGTQPA